jgi:RNA polymerase sigma-70 factor (ECF subfamily)
MVFPVSPDASGTSPTLLARIRASDQQAWHRLVHLYSPLVFAWCRRSGLGSEDAADVMQDVWAVVARAISRYDATRDDSTFRGWLYTVTRNKLTDHHRRRTNRPTAEGGSSAQGRWAELPESEAEGSVADQGAGAVGELHRAVEAVRRDFEPATFRAFWATAIDGRPAAEVAVELGVSADVVYQAKSRVLRRLKQECREGARM